MLTRYAAAEPCRSPEIRLHHLKSTLFLLSTAGFIVAVMMTVTGPLLPLIADEFSKSIGTAGIIVTAFVIPYGVLQIVFGPIGDRIGKLRIIALSLGTSSVFTVATGFVASLESLTILRFLTGMTMAGTVPLAMAYIADEVPYANRQLVIGRYIKGIILGQIAGGCCGGIWAEFFDWRQVFVFIGVLSAAVAVPLWFIASQRPAMQNKHAHRFAEVFATYLEVFRTRRTRAVIMTTTLEGVIIYGILAYLGAFLRHEYGLSYLVIGFVLAAWGVGGGIYTVAVVHIVRLLGERGMIVAGSFTLAVCYLLLTVVPVWWLCVPVFLCAGWGFYTFHNTMQTLATELSPEARGTAVSLWVFMLFIGQGIGVTLVGVTIDGVGYDTAFIAAGLGVATLGLWFQWKLRV